MHVAAKHTTDVADQTSQKHEDHFGRKILCEWQVIWMESNIEDTYGYQWVRFYYNLFIHSVC